MTSVFTFDPEPPKLSSPWGGFPARPSRHDPSTDGSGRRIREPSSSRLVGGLVAPPPLSLSECGVTKLESEPQEGPTEYKLHLLLRPRRSFLMISTSDDVTGSQQGRSAHSSHGELADSEPFKRPHQTQASPQPTFQYRQDRLQHLTTQLLWRLQQSSPYHSTSAASLVLPRLPEAAPRLGVPLRPESLIPGLEDCRGALYEIGVTDNGAFVGLTEDEMNESMTNLRAMAASLGCNVEILRLVIVGDCEWLSIGPESGTAGGDIRKDALLVAEALVLPDTHAHGFDHTDPDHTTDSGERSPAKSSESPNVVPAPKNEVSRTEQLRVSLTGRTTAGKSSLLGTISTSTLDNGRGKSRLSLLKHRHEIATGMTSSVAPELIGYGSVPQHAEKLGSVINYSSGNVSSWDDIHSAAEGSRLVFLTDSAGHPRYRRTIVRGLVSWSPHWILCCIPADENVQPSVVLRGHLPSQGNDRDNIARSSFAHLGLCLKLRLPLVVVITKSDHATRENLRQCLSGVLSMIKASGRKPNLIVRPGAKTTSLGVFSAEDERAATSALAEENVVPIILTSAVTGSGISQLHALLRNVPIRQPSPPKDATPPVLFHVDELYSLPHTTTDGGNHQTRNLVVVSGILRYGTLSVGDFVHVGPFTMGTSKVAPLMERTRSNPLRLLSSPAPQLSSSMPRTEHESSYSPPSSTPTPGLLYGEFLMARIVSVRNLRLPLRTLLQDQTGTIGIEFPPLSQTMVSKLRKGMILARTARQEAQPQSSRVDVTLRACAAIQVRFNEEDYEIMEPGAPFNIYIASVRAVAKIVTVELAPRDSFDPFTSLSHSQIDGAPGVLDPADSHANISLEEDPFGDLEENFEEFGIRSEDDLAKGRRMIDVVFHFLYSPEWVEPGAQVLAMPGHAIAGGIGLDGFVGYVVETRE